ncbi:MAG: prepilin-type N-terminal cleavage/methylation domain-containing protein [Clostridiales bacterium]|nr:prepilin-type N-terminal cleavage/methylation domain-containing protein [Clostridiales bacterium]
MKQYNNKKGITLVELVIALAILGIVLTIGYNLFFAGIKSYGRQLDNADNQARARQVIRQLTREIRRADQIDIIDENNIKIDESLYSFDKNSYTILKDGNVFVTGIRSFKTELVEADFRIKIEITTLANGGKEVTLSSYLSVRE